MVILDPASTLPYNPTTPLFPLFSTRTYSLDLKLQVLRKMKIFGVAATVAACASCVGASPLGTRNNYNVSLENPALFSLHWQMLEKNSTSGCQCRIGISSGAVLTSVSTDETPMVDFLAGFLRSKGLTVELQPVSNPTLE